MAEDGPMLASCPHCGQDHPETKLKCPDTDLALPLQGRLLSEKFRLLRQLGRGGMASVWLANNELVDKRVAIKLIRPEVSKNEETVARFRSEAKAAGRIGHPNICDILDLGMSPLGPYMVMELLQGGSLGDLVRGGKRLPVGLAVAIVRRALRGLTAAHESGVIHRDLKPENVFLHETERRGVVVKLMDFGVSKFVNGTSEAQTEHGALLGTPEYMSPEQFKGAANADERTDVWAVGAILYRTITGRNAFGGPTVAATLLTVASEEPTAIETLVPDIPDALIGIIRRCLSKKPDARYDSAEELSDALAPFDEGLPEDNDLAALVLGGATGSHHAVSDTLNPREEPLTTTKPFRDDDDAISELPTSRRASKTRVWPWALGALGLVAVFAIYTGAIRPATPEPGLDIDPTPAVDGTEVAAVPGQGPLPMAPDLGTLASSTGTGGTGGSGGQGATEPVVATGGSAGAADPAATATGFADTGEETIIIEDDDPEAPIPGKGRRKQRRRKKNGKQNGKSEEPPPPDPPGMVRSGGVLSPKKQGPAGDQRSARRYCAKLRATKLGGITTWHLANPKTAASFAGKGLRSGRYWTSAVWKGKAKVVTLPSGALGSFKTGRKLRPLCVARWP